MKNKKYKIIQIFISIVIITVIFLQMDLDKFKSIRLDIDIQVIFLLILAIFVSVFLRSYRFSIISNDEQDQKISIFFSIKISLVGSALNMFLPAGVGDIARSYFGYKWTGIKERMLSITLLDKLIAIASLFFLALYSYYSQKNFLFLIAGFICVIPYLVFIYFDFVLKIRFLSNIYKFISKRIKKINIDEVFRNSKIKTTTKIYAFALSILGWFFTYLLLYFCFLLLNLNISILKVIAIGPILTIGRLFPFTLNGFGSDEALIIFFFKNNYNSSENIFVAALIYRFVSLILPALLGMIILLLTKKYEKNFEILSDK